MNAGAHPAPGGEQAVATAAEPGPDPGGAPPRPGFDRLARDYDRGRGGLDRGRHAAGNLLPHLVPGSVLEVGVGTGVVALALRELGREVTGVDIAPRMLEQARHRLGPDAVHEGDAEQLPYPQESFDNVVFAHLLHLVDDMPRAVAEAARVLRPGGRIVAVHGHPRGERDDLEATTAPLEDFQQRRADTPAGLRAAAATAGLRVLTQDFGDPYEQGMTPAQLIRSIEDRQIPYLWKIGAADWQDVVLPTVAALRALPDQERPRVNSWRFHRTVLAKG